MTVDFYNVFYNLEATGFYDVILPFLLVFAIAYGVLSKIEMFKKQPGINAVIALILGLLIVTQFEIVARLNLFLPKIAFLIVIILMFLFLIGMVGYKAEKGLKGVGYFIFVLVALVGIYWGLSPSLGLYYYELVPYWIQDTLWEWLIPLVLIIVIIYMIFREPGKPGTKGFEKFVKELGQE